MGRESAIVDPDNIMAWARRVAIVVGLVAVLLALLRVTQLLSTERVVRSSSPSIALLSPSRRR